MESKRKNANLAASQRVVRSIGAPLFTREYPRLAPVRISMLVARYRPRKPINQVMAGRTEPSSRRNPVFVIQVCPYT